MSELRVLSKIPYDSHLPRYLIVCFGGLFDKFGGINRFEFSNHLSKVYNDRNIDILFYIDKKQRWYHEGIDGLTKTIDETAQYLRKQIASVTYERVLFMGTSAGGYASILFGSLCGVHTVVAYFPQTTHKKRMTESKYYDLKHNLVANTNYVIHGDMTDRSGGNHSILECEHICVSQNVKLVKHKGFNMKKLRDTGVIKSQIDEALGLYNSHLT